MADATRSLMHDRDKAKTIKTLWLLGGLGLGAGLMYLVDSAQGEEPRDVVRRHLLDDTTRTLGRQAQAFLAKTPVPFRRQLKRQPGLGERLRTQAEQLGMTTGVVLLGCIGWGQAWSLC